MAKIVSLKKPFKIFLNYFLGPLLFIALSFSIYRHLAAQKDWQHSLNQIRQSLYGSQQWKAILVMALMLANWSCEALKWKVLVSRVEHISFSRAFKAILSGLSVSLAMNTPNGSGEYIGRVLYVRQGNRIRAATLTLVGSISQLLITVVFGALALFVLRTHFYNATIAGVHLSKTMVDWASVAMAVAAVVMGAFYFEISLLVRLLERIPFVARYAYFIQKLEEFSLYDLLKVAAISLVRYAVFVLQYILLLQVFNVGIPVGTAAWLVALMFLALAIVPTIALAELGVRGKLSIVLFGLVSTNTLGIVLTASAIWLVNLVVPALAGSLLVLGIKFFRNK